MQHMLFLKLPHFSGTQLITLDIQVKLSTCQRIVLLNYNKDTKLIDFRHYSIRLQPVGVSRRLRKFVQKHEVPDLRNLQDVSDFVTRYGHSFHVLLLVGHRK